MNFNFKLPADLQHCCDQAAGENHSSAGGRSHVNISRAPPLARDALQDVVAPPLPPRDAVASPPRAAPWDAVALSSRAAPRDVVASSSRTAPRDAVALPSRATPQWAFAPPFCAVPEESVALLRGPLCVMAHLPVVVLPSLWSPLRDAVAPTLSWLPSDEFDNFGLKKLHCGMSLYNSGDKEVSILFVAMLNVCIGWRAHLKNRR